MLITMLKYQPREVTDNYKSSLNLSDEERDIYDLAMQDKSITQISTALMISPSTVSRRLHSIRIKLNMLITYREVL